MEERIDACKPVVDIATVLKTSDSKLLKNLPKFVVKRISRIIREKELNEIHLKYCKYWGIDYVKQLLFNEFNIKITVKGKENVDKTKRNVFIANHPLGGLDALAMLTVVYDIHENVISPSNQLFEYVPNLRPLLLGLNVFGQNTKETAKAMDKLFESDNPILIFPSGEVSRNIDGKIQDTEWKKTFLTKSVAYEREIVPVYISEVNSKKFYRTAKIRKSLGIKSYLETILLPQEMLKKRNSHLEIIIGKPVSYSQIKNSKLKKHEWVQKFRETVYSLGNHKNSE